MNALYNHETISFCLPGVKADHTPPTRYQGFAVVHYSVTFDALYWGILDFRSIGVIQIVVFIPRSTTSDYPHGFFLNR